jgi:hypothetical protein
VSGDMGSAGFNRGLHGPRDGPVLTAISTQVRGRGPSEYCKMDVIFVLISEGQ